MSTENVGTVDALIDRSRVSSKARIRKYYYYTIIPVGIGLIWLIFSFSQVRNLNTKISALSDSIARAKRDLRTYRDSVKSEKRNLELLKYLNSNLQVEYLRYLQSGTNNHSFYNALEQSIQANNYLKNRVKKFNIDKRLNIWYFQKTIDAERVQLALKELGYENIRISQTDNGLLVNGETNSIGFGTDVHFQDLQIVILTLIRAGFKIEYVYPSEGHKNLTTTIQILRTEAYRNGKVIPAIPLTVGQIIKAKNKEEIIRSYR